MCNLLIRRASSLDAAGIVSIVKAVVSERTYSAIDKAWTIDEETRYLESLSHREGVHVAINESGLIVGLQSLDLWSAAFPSMAHVGQVGTFVLPQCRNQGVGRGLWSATKVFAKEAGYSKLVIQVRASNAGAQKFYARLGFKECGRLNRQVIIDGIEDDEILMEYFV